VRLQEGTVARYIVQEQLAALDFPNDAIGETSQVSGAIALSGDGRIVPDESRITVNVQSLRSDTDKRDDYLRENSLESDRFPTVDMVVREAPGLPWPFPAQGEASFQLVGDMTIRDVTREVTWDVTAQFNGDLLTGQARTRFTFDHFDMEVPSAFLVISVENDIRLEMDFVASVAPGQ
jgi:polyisoprenoid-binding protein YceI